MELQWWQKAVFYQIYPRSFADSNGDGIGDLDGITAHLDYLNDGTEQSLGIDGLWLGPIFPSPMDDFGYDVSDFCAIHSDFGTLSAFDRLLNEAHRRNIRVFVDLVPNHTSYKHPWFEQSRSSRSNPKRDWYVWIDGEPHRPPNNWLSAFGGPSWHYDERTAGWYLHSFYQQQPDLNWRNPQVELAIHDAMRFWLDRGVDGFRVDAILMTIKDAALRDNPPRTDSDPWTKRDPQGAQLHLHDQDRPEVHDVIRGLRRVTDSYQGRAMVGEVWPRERGSLWEYVRSDEFQMGFNFPFFHTRWQAAGFRAAIEHTERSFGAAWPTYTLSNHDFSRHITRYSDGDQTVARARLAALMLLTLRGTPFLYYGEEIGMPDVEIPRTRWLDRLGRDRSRTPMQWSHSAPGGGFTAGQPWLPIGDASLVSVDAQREDPASLLALYRRLIWMRKRWPALREGSYRLLDSAPGECLAYFRQTPSQRLILALNFSEQPRLVHCPVGKLIFSTDPRRRLEPALFGVKLGPVEGVIVEILP